ncbi:GGDEF and EAL domain-containing protein [Thiomicrorhabdus sp. Milos-T2]|uniref:sensor domain-containing protein n=1 Tax=Thiomicrorhabdus sp. Milos-T2 TaxID=90814 RepID=UPI0006905C14|nr:GGDEF and EAL domain-containing protein [Thiomicrorhabdus sp. Milos-T2]
MKTLNTIISNAGDDENSHLKELLNFTLEGSQDGVWDWNVDTNEVYYSPRWKAILGYQDDELIANDFTWESLLHPDDIAAAKNYNQKFLQGNQSSYEANFRMRHKDGHYVPILSRAKKSVFHDPLTNKSSTHLIGIHIDLTKIITIQEQLQQQTELTNTYLNNTSAIMLALDVNANVTMLNKKGEETLGVSAASLIGQSWFELSLMPPEIHKNILNTFNDFIHQRIELNESIDHELITKNGERRMFTWSNALLKDKNGQVIGTLSSAIDITEHYKLQEKLKKNENLLKNAQKLAKIGHYTLDILDEKWNCSEEVNVMFGLTPSYPKTIKSWLAIIHPDHQKMMKEYLYHEVICERQAFDKEFKIINQLSKKSLWVHGIGTLKLDEQGNPIELFGTIQNISRIKRTEKRITLASKVYKNAHEGIIVTNSQGKIIDVNIAFSNITGFSRKEVLGKNPNLLSSGIHQEEFYNNLWNTLLKNGSWEGEIWNKRKNGEIYPTFIRISTIKNENDEILNFLALFSDITEQKNNELKLKKMTHFDCLTGLPNRTMFTDILTSAISDVDAKKSTLSLAFLDLDGFKQINDTLGHEIGDQVLKIISTRYIQDARDTDIVARIGGDEFVILLKEIDSIEESINIYERFLEATRKPIVIDGHKLQISCSIGISYYPQTLPVDSGQLIRQADNAMYQAKIAGKDSYHIFDDVQDQIARELHQKIIAINHAITHDELVLFYQPKVDMPSQNIIGVEALIRWQHPEKGLLPPIEFLPAIEKNSTSIYLDKWVIEHAFFQAKQWILKDIAIPISVNIGAQILQNFKLIEFLEKMIAKYPKVPTKLIELEVLETSALEDMHHVSIIMQTCQDLGFKISIDDFGTGYSSLEYLKSLSASYLKIDQSFVRDMLIDNGDLAILKAVIGLAQAFDMQTIAEGVETEEHSKELIKLGCNIGQGYGIAKPMPAQALQEWLKH